MIENIRIAAAGNAEVPAYLALKAKGYVVERSVGDDDAEAWWARKDGLEFIAGGPIELLGVVGVYESRGENWQATDSEIESFLSQFP